MAKGKYRDASLMSDQRMLQIIQKAFQEYEGQFDVLETAVGALVLGRYVGWQAIHLLHPGTFRKYEGILGVKFKEVLPERGPDCMCLRGMRMVDAIGKFWQVAKARLIPPGEMRAKLPVQPRLSF